VAAWLTTFLETIAPRTVSPETLESTYGPKIRNRVIPYLGKHRLDRLQPEHLDAFYAHLEAEGLAPNTVLQIHRILSRALKVAVKRGRLARNPCTLVDPPRGDQSAIEPLTREEVQAILRVVRDRRNGSRWVLALATGIRQSEALGLRWSFLDLDQGVMRVWWQIKRTRYRHGCPDPHACGRERHLTTCPPGCVAHARWCPDRIGGGWHFVERKGEHLRGDGRKLTLALPPAAVAALRAHRAQQSKERLRAGDTWEDWDLVWCQASGRPIDPRADWTEWQEVLTAAGVRAARVHDVRHTTGTLLVDEGVELRIVQEVLGHSSSKMTERYTHVTDRGRKQAADAAARALWGN
jgi:integrase